WHAPAEGPSVAGVFELEFSVERLEQLVALRGWELVPWYVVVFGALLVLLSWSLKRLLLDPVCLLERHGRELRDGKLEGPIRLDRGDELGLLAQTMDSTRVNLKASREEILKQLETVQTLLKLKAEFLATMSHEIRTPMNGVIGMTELLLATELTGEQREYAETIQRSGQALLAILNDILDFEKIEAGKLELETTDLDPWGLAEDTLELFTEQSERKRLELGLQVHPGVPRRLWGDPGRLRQVLTNLVGNAVKFTPAGEVLVRCLPVESWPEEVLLRFEVVDTGVGVAPEVRGRLFHAFCQADGSTTRQFGGTGLGLAISKRLVERMGGEIGLESECGKGSTFWFTVRLERDPVVGRERPIDLGRVRVLVADGSPVRRRRLSELLAAWGAEPLEAAASPEVTKRLTAGVQTGTPCHAVLLDLGLPGGGGESVVRWVRAQPGLQALRVVALGRLGQCAQSSSLDSLGVAAKLLRPLRPSRLLDCLLESGEAPGTASGTSLPQVVSAPPVPRSQRGASGRRLLVAEDNPLNQQLLLQCLKRWGFQVDLVPSGLEAVKAVSRTRYHAILMDLHMPEMGGLEATRAIRELEASSGRPRVPIIALTADAMPSVRRSCLEAGMDDYLAKPYRSKDLLGLIERWLGEAGAPGETARRVVEEPV
ncbi:MAG: response regulator, partial [Planctomycetes bacterium]|nr:response regulator [Planctomycetota bacterium]